ncbi:MAG TPA: sn-glycerol-1-phosphate dehydrogenase [Rectinemataceae bacterium]|nr:sn-glycerol-1-phosphate dehydrogenase [Rectinemataceae bacterium]
MNRQSEPVLRIGSGASKALAGFLRKRRSLSARLVADASTWAARGASLARELEAEGIRVLATRYDETALVADARSILKLFTEAADREETLVAVGSGTITDIVRFVAHRSGREFVSIPTAPSVDAYSSIVAPILIDGVKRTLTACAPLAIFADLDVLAAAPRPMLSAGFGDMICKFSAIADWRLGALLWDEGYDPRIAERSLKAARSCMDCAAGIGAADAPAVGRLMEALLESGSCMAEAGHSRPASGAEHQYSHFWEMRLLREGRPPILHGLKVGVATVLTARLWDRVRALSAGEARRAFDTCRPPAPDEERRAIATAFGAEAAEIESGQRRFLELGAEGRSALAAKAAERWEDILEIARIVPDESTTRSLLEAALCPTEPLQLGLEARDIELAQSSAHFLRDRLTVRKLARLLFGE